MMSSLFGPALSNMVMETFLDPSYEDGGAILGAILDSNGEAITDLPNGEAIEEN